jgi:hypothetical protein
LHRHLLDSFSPSAVWRGNVPVRPRQHAYSLQCSATACSCCTTWLVSLSHRPYLSLFVSEWHTDISFIFLYQEGTLQPDLLRTMTTAESIIIPRHLHVRTYHLPQHFDTHSTTLRTNTLFFPAYFPIQH